MCLHFFYVRRYIICDEYECLLLSMSCSGICVVAGIVRCVDTVYRPGMVQRTWRKWPGQSGEQESCTTGPQYHSTTRGSKQATFPRLQTPVALCCDLVKTSIGSDTLLSIVISNFVLWDLMSYFSESISYGEIFTPVPGNNTWWMREKWYFQSMV